MAETQYEIIKELYSFPDSGGNFHKELNLISWYGKEPKYDVRGWNEDKSKMTKGISLSKEEFQELIDFGQAYLGGE